MRPFLLRVLALSSLLGCSSPGVPSDASLGGDAPSAPDAATDDAAILVDAAPDVDASLPAFPAIASLLGSGHATLFVGNSYTFFNDLPAIYRTAAATLPETPVRVESVTAGGYLLAQHASDATAEGTPLSMLLLESATPWDAVVLQEQSQIPGFPEGSSDRQASIDAASSLGRLTAMRGGSVVLYLTWGRERGDETNLGLYPDFPTMEMRLEAGYRAMAARLASEDVDVRIAPVGPAFARVHAAVIATGGDPTAEGSDFDTLYDTDGSHPTARGSYLASCVILSTITGRDPFTFPDGAGLGAEDARALRLVARETMADPAWTP